MSFIIVDYFGKFHVPIKNYRVPIKKVRVPIKKIRVPIKKIRVPIRRGPCTRDFLVQGLLEDPGGFREWVPRMGSASGFREWVP